VAASMLSAMVIDDGLQAVGTNSQDLDGYLEEFYGTNNVRPSKGSPGGVSVVGCYCRRLSAP
jgi:hypothetical protein